VKAQKVVKWTKAEEEEWFEEWGDAAMRVAKVALKEGATKDDALLILDMAKEMIRTARTPVKGTWRTKAISKNAKVTFWDESKMLNGVSLFTRKKPKKKGR
jgi:hypothetical protein